MKTMCKTMLALLAALLAVGVLAPLGEAKTKRSKYAVRPEEVYVAPEQRLLREWGVGLILGDPTGVTVKYWMDSQRAWDFALGTQLGLAGVGVHADYEHHLRLFPDAPEAPIYVGGGLFLGGSNEAINTGFRGVIGMAYLFEEPFDIFMQLSPNLALLPEVEFYFTFSIGARLYL